MIILNYFLNHQKGFISSTVQGSLLFTIDGGNTWQIDTISNLIGGLGTTMEFINDDTYTDIQKKIKSELLSSNNKFDNKLSEYETKLKREGKYEEYERDIVKQNIKYHITEMENVLLDLLMNTSGEQFVTENGEIEEWKGKGVDNQFIQDIQEYIQKLKGIVND